MSTNSSLLQIAKDSRHEFLFGIVISPWCVENCLKLFGDPAGWMTARFELRFLADQINELGGDSGAGGMPRRQISESPKNGDEEVADGRRARTVGRARRVEYEPFKHLRLPLWEAESGKHLRSVVADQRRQREPVVDAR